MNLAHKTQLSLHGLPIQITPLRLIVHQRKHQQQAVRREISEVPGAYQLLNVFSEQECRKLLKTSEELGYLKDAAVSLPREIRHNDNVTIVVDDATERLIWQRIEALTQQNLAIFDGKKPLGINTRFRFYRYQEGDYFKYHIDGDWPGSKVEGDTLIHNAYSDRYSKMTFLILLNDNFEGGETQFLVNADQPGKPAKTRRQTSTSKCANACWRCALISTWTSFIALFTQFNTNNEGR